MTAPSSSSSSSANTVVGRLEALRDAAQGLAAGSLHLAQEADRAIEAVSWGVENGLITAFPTIYVSELDAAHTQLANADTGISSALSTVQFIVSGSTSGAVGTALESTGPVLITAPTFQRESAQSDLDEHLTTLWGGGSLAERRRDAWLAFHRGTPESSTQACHTLREILTDILDRFAPNDDVKSAPWWKPDPQTRDGVSKRHKVKYLVICGDDTALSEGLLAELTAQVEHAMSAHQLTIKIAHRNIDTNAATAHVAMADLEEVMLTLLRQRRKFDRC